MPVIYASPVTTRLPTDPPDHLTEPQVRSLYSLLQDSISSVVQGIETYTSPQQKQQDTWSTQAPENTLLAQNLNRLYVKAGEAINYGALINLYDLGAGVLGVRNANATNNTKPCHGWCTTVGGIANTAYGEVILGHGLCVAIGGLTIGTRYFLSTTNGIATNTAPVAAGNIEQPIGFGLGATKLFMNITSNWIQH